MRKIQYGIAGFFAGAFTGLLLSLVEMRIINGQKHPARLFLIVALTVILCGIFGLMKALQIEKKSTNK